MGPPDGTRREVVGLGVITPARRRLLFRVGRSGIRVLTGRVWRRILVVIRGGSVTLSFFFYGTGGRLQRKSSFSHLLEYRWSGLGAFSSVLRGKYKCLA